MQVMRQGIWSPVGAVIGVAGFGFALFVLWPALLTSGTAPSRARSEVHGPCTRFQRWASAVLANSSSPEADARSTTIWLGQRNICCSDQLFELDSSDMPAAAVDALRARAVLDQVARTERELGHAKALLRQTVKAHTPTKLLYVAAGNMNNGLGNEYQLLRWALFFAKASGRVLAVDSVSRTIPAFNEVYSALNFSLLDATDPLTLSPAVEAALFTAWGGGSRTVSAVSIDGSRAQWQQQDLLRAVSVNWRTDPRVKSLFGVGFPGSSVGVDDQLEMLLSLNRHDIVSISDRTLFFWSFHCDQFRWGAARRPCMPHYASPPLSPANTALYDSVVGRLPFKDELIQSARAWVRETFGADRVPAAVSFRRNQRNLKECAGHWYHSNCLKVCYQNVTDMVDVLRNASRLLSPGVAGRPQVFVTMMVTPARGQPAAYQFGADEIAAVERALPPGTLARFVCPEGMPPSRCSLLEWLIAASADLYWANFQSTYSAAILAMRAGAGVPDSANLFYF